MIVKPKEVPTINAEKIGSMHEYTVNDWLEIHCIDAALGKIVLATLHLRKNHSPPDTSTVISTVSAQEAWSLASKALDSWVPELSSELGLLDQVCERRFDAPSTELPFTLDRGSARGPLVSTCYAGTPADILCVAHEFGHALQYHLAKGRFIPPVLRELAAFISEKAFLDFIQTNRNEVYDMLHSAWQQDNRIYFGDDTDNLLDALKSPTDPYTYRMNYPLARLLSVVLFDALPRDERPKVFHGSVPLAEYLLNTHQNGAAIMNNYLPDVPEADNDRPAISAYRTLGAMALLDIDYWQGESEKSIEEYYSARLGHMQSQTAFVAIDSDRKPIGYATWETDPNDASIVRLKRQAAPFGDHLELQEKLQARLPEDVTVLTHHSRSAREEQVAW